MILNLKNYLYAIFLICFIPLPSLSESLHGSEPEIRGRYYICPQGVTEIKDFWKDMYQNSKYLELTRKDINVTLYKFKPGSINTYSWYDWKDITEALIMSVKETRGSYKLSSIRTVSEYGLSSILYVLKNNKSKKIIIKPYFGVSGVSIDEIWDNNNRNPSDIGMDVLGWGLKMTKRFCVGDFLIERFAGLIKWSLTNVDESDFQVPTLILVKDYFAPLGVPKKIEAPAF